MIMASLDSSLNQIGQSTTYIDIEELAFAVVVVVDDDDDVEYKISLML